MPINNSGSNGCKCCERGSLDTNTKFSSVCSNVEYTVDFTATCQTKFCIYQLGCKKCSMQYVGKTIETVRDRLNGHRGHIRRGTEALVMHEHFAGKDGHDIASITIKPIEVCNNKKTLNEREKYWIKELNTVYPYGLNMDASYAGIKNAFEHIKENKAGKTIYSTFNIVKSRRGYSGGKKKRGVHARPIEDMVNVEFNTITWLNDIVTNNPMDNNIVHTLRTAICKLTINNLKDLFLRVTIRINSNEKLQYVMHGQLLLVVRDICLHKLQTLHESNKNVFIVINHVNKIVEKVGINYILKDVGIQSLFPVKSELHSTPSVSYAYSESIRSSIVNYNQVISDPNYENFECNCKSYPAKFIDVNHGHIITGDMNIVSNIPLRNLLTKGLGYHEQQAPNKVEAFTAIKAGLDSYINDVSGRLSVQVNAFTGWKTEILGRVRNKLHNIIEYDYNNILGKHEVKKALCNLHKDFAVIPVDKASKNVAIVCKKHYIDIMSEEIENSPTFRHVSDDDPHLFVDNLKATLNMQFINSKLPSMYATAKMHKFPKKFRYITSARNTIFSSLSENIGMCLKLLLKFAHTSYKYRIQAIDNCIFIVDNRDKVIKFLEESNNNACNNKCVSTWDFATLYTKIPHDKLKRKISLFISKVMDDVASSNKAAKFICCSSKWSVYFSKSRSKTNASYSKEELIDNAKRIIDNCYVLYHENIFRQVIGIPMGTNCAPYLANIFLHMYEYDYLKMLVDKGEIVTAKKLANTFRYQDDCIALDDDGEFGKHFSKIYPSEMVLESTNITKCVVTFLDLRISIFRGRYLYRSYDKRDNFQFTICNYPHLTGNVPLSSSYGVYLSQLVRLCDINQQWKFFVSDVRKMTRKFIKQGFVLKHLRRQFIKFYEKYINKWAKYGVDISRLQDLIFPVST